MRSTDHFVPSGIDGAGRNGQSMSKFGLEYWRGSTDVCSDLDDGVQRGKLQLFAGLRPKLSGHEHFCQRDEDNEAGFIHGREYEPVALELGPDTHRPGSPFLPVNDPVEFVCEETSVERFDVESMRIREGGHGGG